jgi:acyl-CoA reductase-like NAD-dependent aldehyde dehydrogenase
MAALISAEIGAPITFAKMAQVRLPLTMMSAFCGLAGDYQLPAGASGLVRQGHSNPEATAGVVDAVVPWNMPQFLTVAKVVQALLAGCSVCSSPHPSPCSARSCSRKRLRQTRRV